MGRHKGSPWQRWTAEDLATLRALAGNAPLAEIARRLGRSQSAVQTEARCWGLSLRIIRR